MTPGSRHAGRNVSREEKVQHFLVERPWFYSLCCCWSFGLKSSERCTGTRLQPKWVRIDVSDSHFHYFCWNVIFVINLTATIWKIWRPLAFSAATMFFFGRIHYHQKDRPWRTNFMSHIKDTFFIYVASPHIEKCVETFNRYNQRFQSWPVLVISFCTYEVIIIYKSYKYLCFVEDSQRLKERYKLFLPDLL